MLNVWYNNTHIDLHARPAVCVWQAPDTNKKNYNYLEIHKPFFRQCYRLYSLFSPHHPLLSFMLLLLFHCHGHDLSYYALVFSIHKPLWNTIQKENLPVFFIHCLPGFFSIFQQTKCWKKKNKYREIRIKISHFLSFETYWL
jgi:hypothetical protein